MRSTRGVSAPRVRCLSWKRPSIPAMPSNRTSDTWNGTPVGWAVTSGPIIGITSRRQPRRGGGDPCDQRGLNGAHLGHFAIHEGINRQMHFDDDTVGQDSAQRCEPQPPEAAGTVTMRDSGAP